MASIKAEVNFTISDGCSIVFRAPCDASAVTNLIVYYPNAGGETTSQTFTFKDAHGNNLANIDNLFASGAMVKVILDTVNSVVYIQNADTNAYLEDKFDTKADKPTVLTGTLTAGSTSLVMSDSAITESSILDIYTDTYGISPTVATVETGSVTLTFDKQSSDLGVSVEVR